MENEFFMEEIDTESLEQSQDSRVGVGGACGLGCAGVACGGACGGAFCGGIC